MYNIIAVVLIVGLALASSAARAQTTCPPGETLVTVMQGNPPVAVQGCQFSSSSSGGGDSSSSSGSDSGSGTSSSDSSEGGIFTAFAQWLKDFLLYIPKWIWQSLLQAFAALINAIPVPSWFATFGSAAGSFTSDALFWLNFIQFKAGVGMVGGALLLRFLLRRIPFIG